MFLSRGLFWRILTICVLWFSSGFSFYGLTLGVNALPFDRYYLTAIIGCVESTSRHRRFFCLQFFWLQLRAEKLAGF